MALFAPSNQLLQIDTGNWLTYLFNQSLSPISVYAGIGENQVLGQLYYASNSSLSNPSGSPAIYMLVQYQSIAQPAPVAYPAPVYWIDNTLTKVSGVQSDGGGGLNSVAGYMGVNTTSIPTLTAAKLQTALMLIQISGILPGALVPGATAAGDTIIGAAGNFTPGRVASGTAPNQTPYGTATTAIVANTATLLLQSSIW